MITKETIIDRLKAAGISPSEQRITVYEYLATHPVHPTVDTIYQALCPSHPTLSRTTVYNTLKIFVAQKLVQSLNIEDNGLRFDADPHFHAHCKCRLCGKVIDFPCSAPQDAPSPADFLLESTQVTYYGVCKVCQNQKTES